MVKLPAVFDLDLGNKEEKGEQKREEGKAGGRQERKNEGRKE